MIQRPLISIIVLTYNSSEYVLSTLESIKRQTYTGPIELIIGDDCSQDDTVSICQQWLESNKARFANTRLLQPIENQGVVGNINSCLKIAEGEWIKDIAGDDILADNAIDTLYHAATDGEDCYHFVISSLYSFERDEQIAHPENLAQLKIKGTNNTITLKNLFQKPSFWTNAPSFFYSKKLVVDIGYCPTLFRNVEDRPMMAKALSKGYTVRIIDAPTVFYRNNPSSITNTVAKAFYAECNWRTYKEILRSQFSTLQAIDMDLRMLPQWCLMKRKKKDIVTKLFRLGCLLTWAIYRAFTFPFTRRF